MAGKSTSRRQADRWQLRRKAENRLGRSRGERWRERLRRRQAPQAVQKHVQHSGMDRLGKAKTGAGSLDPGHVRFNRLQPVELDPHAFVDLRTFDELATTAVRGEVEGLGCEGRPAGPSQNRLAGKHSSFRSPRRRLASRRVRHEPQACLACRAPSNNCFHRAATKDRKLHLLARRKLGEQVDSAAVERQIEHAHVDDFAVSPDDIASQLHRAALVSLQQRMVAGWG